MTVKKKILNKFVKSTVKPLVNRHVYLANPHPDQANPGRGLNTYFNL